MIVRAIAEDRPGPTWAALFDEFWPAYRRWFLKQGERARPTYLEGRTALERSMPELLDLYDELVELAGGSDHAARFLSLYRPTPYVFGCSQLVTDGRLIRNYDYAPELWEGVVLRTRWNGRTVMGMSDCVWGLLDGVNEAGLVASLAFGGSRKLGEGFGMPLIVRYILQTCDDVAQACAALRRVPSHMAYNVTLVDAAGEAATVHVDPEGHTTVTSKPAVTNHGCTDPWEAYLRRTRSRERLDLLGGLERATTQAVLQAFGSSPLHATDYEQSAGTLYTAIYEPGPRRVEYRWTGTVNMCQRLDAFAPQQVDIPFPARPTAGD